MSINELEIKLDQFLLECDSRMLSTKTMRAYDQTVKLFIYYLENECNVSEVKEVKGFHFKKYVSHLRERGKYTVVTNEQSKNANHPDNRTDLGSKMSDTTIANYMRNIKVFFNFLYKYGDINTNLSKAIPKIKPKRKQKELLNQFEIERLFKAFDITKFHEYRLWIGVRLILDTGLRVGELLSLKPNDFDMTYNTILIKEAKGGKERFVYFSNRMSRDLKRWLKYRDRFSDSEYMFPTNRGTQQTVGNFETTLNRVAERVGIKVTPHLLRNNFAKYYLLNNGDFATLSRILGHASVETTMKAYLDFTDDQVRQKYQQHSPLEGLKL